MFIHYNPNPPNRYINDNRIYVQGEAGANSYPIGPATVVQLMDNEKPYFYIKSSDIFKGGMYV